MLKYYGSELTKRGSELMVSMMGPRGLGQGDDTENFTENEREITRNWLFHKALTIAGGCSEVQLDIISKRILELPST
ncbi:MAG TPA: acyl-CoA dehydrogenase family protein, partial [Pseudomonadales bacterium]|nr:acyl-CoA dehydrogenase family protein [Pseudomonadales bacterium]